MHGDGTILGAWPAFDVVGITEPRRGKTERAGRNPEVVAPTVGRMEGLDVPFGVDRVGRAGYGKWRALRSNAWSP